MRGASNSHAYKGRTGTGDGASRQGEELGQAHRRLTTKQALAGTGRQVLPVTKY